MADDLRVPIKSVLDITQQSARPPVHAPSDMELVHVESQDGVMRKHWEKVMCRELGAPDTYQKVAVLIIRWEDSLDADLKTKDEVDELNTLFRDGFKFESEVKVLHNRKRPQALIDSYISKFVADHDGHHRSHLLIVYYTGHGFSRGNNLIISGTSIPRGDSEQLYRPEAKWDQAETSLNDAEADVLTILDCCFAGSVMKRQSEHSKLYELLAACGRDGETDQPGERSYSRALIDSLKGVLQSQDKRVYTFDLNQMILRKRSWNETPHVYNRLQTSTTRHICLAPLSEPSETAVEDMPRNAGHLTLRFAFRDHNCLSSDLVEQLAFKVSQATKETKLGISAIDWMGFEPFTCRARLVMAVNRVLREKQESHKRKLSSNEQGEDEPVAKRQHRSSNNLSATQLVESPVDVINMPTPDPSSRGTTPR